MIFQLTLLIGLFIIWVFKKTQKPNNFPPSPPRWPFLGSFYYTLPPGSKRPNLFYAVTQFAEKYGSIFGFWINQVTFVVLTEYEDIKEVLKMEAIAGRVAGEPGNRMRPGWESMSKFDPEVNKGRAPGVLGGNVRNISKLLKKSFYTTLRAKRATLFKSNGFNLAHVT